MKRVVLSVLPFLVVLGFVWHFTVPTEHVFLPSFDSILDRLAIVPNLSEQMADSVGVLNARWSYLGDIFSGSFDVFTFFSDWLPNFFEAIGSVWGVVVSFFGAIFSYMGAIFSVFFPSDLFA